MSTKPNPDNRLSELARLDAIEATTWPPRIARAVLALDDHRSPLRAATLDTTSGNSDTIPLESTDMRNARSDRAALIRLVLEREKLGRAVTAILDRWAPRPTRGGPGDTENATLWCPNHLTHGMREPRAANGQTHCAWCANVHRNFDAYPTAKLINLHAEGRRIDEATYRRLLGRGAA